MGVAKRMIPIVVLVFSQYSCVKEKYVFKSNDFYSVKIAERGDEYGSLPNGEDDSLYTIRFASGFKGKVVEFEDYLIITPTDQLPKSDSISDTFEVPKNPAVMMLRVSKIEPLRSKMFSPNIFSETKGRKYFTYFESKPVLQTLSIPIKIRSKLTDSALKDSFPQDVSTGFNLGLAGGWKFSVNFYNPSKDIFGNKGLKLSLTPGIFYGMGATKVSKSNTRKPIYQFDRNALTHSFGGFFMFGFNNINLGYATGWDYPTKDGSKSWLYRGKRWHGVAIGFDLIK